MLNLVVIYGFACVPSKPITQAAENAQQGTKPKKPFKQNSSRPVAEQYQTTPKKIRKNKAKPKKRKNQALPMTLRTYRGAQQPLLTPNNTYPNVRFKKNTTHESLFLNNDV